MSRLSTLLQIWQDNSGGLAPTVDAYREKFQGDQSQTVRVGVTWLRLRATVSLNLPHGRKWDPR